MRRPIAAGTIALLLLVQTGCVATLGVWSVRHSLLEPSPTTTRVKGVRNWEGLHFRISYEDGTERSLSWDTKDDPKGEQVEWHDQPLPIGTRIFVNMSDPMPLWPPEPWEGEVFLCNRGELHYYLRGEFEGMVWVAAPGELEPTVLRPATFFLAWVLMPATFAFDLVTFPVQLPLWLALTRGLP